MESRERSKTDPPQSWEGIAEELASELRGVIRGEVRFDRGSRALYATDASNYRQVPIGVVVPKDKEDVIQTISLCRRYGAPVLPRGGGTSLAGQCCNVAVVMDMSKYMHHILALDPDQKIARVQPGVVLDHLRTRAETFHLTFAPDPATHSHNTLGGMIGNNSCGVHSVMGGKTVDNVHELEILTYDGLHTKVGETSAEELEAIIKEGGRRGEIYAGLKALRDQYAPLIRERYPDIPRRVSGFNLDSLLEENGFHVARALVGSEGTCVTVLEATLRLVHSPPSRVLVILGYPDVYTAGDHILEVLEHGPVGLEGIDQDLVHDLMVKKLRLEGVEILPEGSGWLLVEFGGENRSEGEARAHAFMEALKKTSQPPHMKLFDNRKEEELIWKVREAGLAATARIPGEPDSWPGWEDSAVPPKHVGDYLRDLRKLLKRYGYHCSLYGHFGQGCIHTRIDFDLLTRKGIEKYRSFMEEASDLVLRYGGSLSGEHGDGQARGELLTKMFGEKLVQAFREFKSIWDPGWKMNPGKVVDPYRLDENLRLGTSYNPPPLKTHFQFPEDKGSFAYAALRCVGVGECRKELKGAMCPSYMATREEMHSTRGRARLLFEMVHGGAITEGWRSDHVREALDLCLSCKSCKGECPMQVDMAMFKAEFLSHYYGWRPRPLDAYSMGLIYWWSRIASKAPQVANFFLQTPPLSNLLKRLGGISTRRSFPLFAKETFRDWFHRRPKGETAKPQVLLWADTFNNFFYPEVAKAAVRVLESHGFEVLVPQESLCCGRPLFDYGMLDLAKALLCKVLKVLGPLIEKGVPLVGLEPACLSTFRDELTALFPHDQNAHRLSAQSFLLSEFLGEKIQGFDPPKLPRKAIVHGHCTHKAVMKMDAEEEVLGKLGLDFNVLDSGCCGVSGAFGFRKNNFDLSMQIGERVLLPAVRKASKDTLIIANGFSCREQIAQSTDRMALHLAQVLCMAMEYEGGEPPEEYPENRFYGRNRRGD
jgi:FAD/FMN-containing dehydrogenase/Fe-S oxidoreductase